MEELSDCPICENTIFHSFLECKDYTVSEEKFSIVQCDSCDFKFTNPRPSKEEIGAYYKSESYISHTNSNKGIFNRIYQGVRKYTLAQKYKLVSGYTHGNQILDYGCGTGEFLNYCKGKGMQTTGIEQDEGARNAAINNYGLSIFNEDKIAQFEAKTFHIITLWHVLEHVHELKNTVARLWELLKEDGVVFIAVPNPTSYDAKHYGNCWAAYDVPRHLYHFSPENIKQLFESLNFESIKILPMKFDSYYVSLLSEKYKSGYNNPIEAFLTGLKSNLLASKKNNNYSSQLYVFKKEAK